MRTKRRYTPSDEELEQMLADGLTHQQIADIATERAPDGVVVTRATVSMAIVRAKLSQRPRERYDDYVPWHPIAERHRKKYALTMLRLYARRSRGEAMTAEEKGDLKRWLDRLRIDGLVVTYRPRTRDGFRYVRRSSVRKTRGPISLDDVAT